jgi:hypothetical protein
METQKKVYFWKGEEEINSVNIAKHILAVKQYKKTRVWKFLLINVGIDKKGLTTRYAKCLSELKTFEEPEVQELVSELENLVPWKAEELVFAKKGQKVVINVNNGQAEVIGEAKPFQAIGTRSTNYPVSMDYVPGNAEARKAEQDAKAKVAVKAPRVNTEALTSVLKETFKAQGLTDEEIDIKISQIQAAAFKF